MTSHDLILQWLDGSLGSEAEAELLHILSVSPERREVLHSYLQQKKLVDRDMASINVPYAAEEALWQRLGAVMPVTAPVGAVSSMVGVETSALLAPTAIASAPAAASIFSQLGSPIAASLAVVALVLGLGVGYVMGGRASSTLLSTETASALASTASQPMSVATAAIANSANRSHGNAATPTFSNLNTNFGYAPLNAISFQTLSNEALSKLFLEHVYRTSHGLNDMAVESSDILNNTEIEPIALHPTIAVADARNIGGDPKENPLHIANNFATQEEQTLLQRFEFSVLESFGREFPNSAATNVSMPVVTNSALGVFFQVFPKSTMLWVGASGGTANLTRKHLLTQAGDPGDPLQQQLTSELGHVQTNWAGGFVQLRLPFIAKSDLTFTGGYGMSGAGQMAIGELGLHFDATRDVGFQLGVRGIQLSYDLSGEKDAALKSARGSIVIVHGAADSQPSYNLELSTGLFFHF